MKSLPSSVIPLRTRSPRSAEIEDHTWERLLESYRQNPADTVKAARYADTSKAVAATAWHTGYGPEFPPIREVLIEEETRARARIGPRCRDRQPGTAGASRSPGRCRS